MNLPVRSDSGQFRIPLFAFAIILVSFLSSLTHLTGCAMK
jgi:hypothetical protein